MGRLIDQDTLMQDIRNTITEQSSTLDWLNLINRQPTAYDVDAVVKQLEEMAEEHKAYWEMEECTAIKRAIEIVKGGGVDGNRRKENILKTI